MGGGGGGGEGGGGWGEPNPNGLVGVLLRIWSSRKWGVLASLGFRVFGVPENRRP